MQIAYVLSCTIAMSFAIERLLHPRRRGHRSFGFAFILMALSGMVSLAKGPVDVIAQAVVGIASLVCAVAAGVCLEPLLAARAGDATGSSESP